jgi:hypothetical protein
MTIPFSWVQPPSSLLQEHADTLRSSGHCGLHLFLAHFYPFQGKMEVVMLSTTDERATDPRMTNPQASLWVSPVLM